MRLYLGFLYKPLEIKLVYAVTESDIEQKSAMSASNLDHIVSLIKHDMHEVDVQIKHRLSSDIVLINNLSAYIINSGGKRLRPVMLLLAARACSQNVNHAVLLAAVIEFIHTATLLHDDVVDASELRRGNATANSVWGNEASVLVGDFLYSRAFEMMVETSEMSVMKIMAETTNRIAEGEVLQLLNAHEPGTNEQQYLETITRKTAKLFESAGHLGAISAGASIQVQDALATYGLHLGIAFQIVDDLLDFSQTAETMGKNQGDDLSEGKPTLPMIHAMQHASPEDRKIIEHAIREGDSSKFVNVAKIIESTDSLTYTSKRAQEEALLAKNALNALPNSEYKQALSDLADFSVARTF